MPAKKRIVIATIDTSPERTYIEIDGKQYGCITANEMELRQLNALSRMQRRFGEGFDDESDEGMEQLSEVLNQMVHIILIDAPDEVHEKLHDFHRMEIVRAFTLAASSEKTETEPPIEPSSEESPDLPASSEAELAAG